MAASGKGDGHALPARRGFNQVGLGERFESAMTLTETHIVLGAGLFGDFNRLHVDEPFARASRHGGRIAHGYLTSALIAASFGMSSTAPPSPTSSTPVVSSGRCAPATP